MGKGMVKYKGLSKYHTGAWTVWIKFKDLFKCRSAACTVNPSPKSNY